MTNVQEKERTDRKAQAKAPNLRDGRFVWHELATTDPEAAQAFYRQVIGWATAPFADADPDEPYTMWMTGETPQGGVMELPEMAREQGAPPHWLTYVAVADTDEIVDRAQALGGKVHYGPVSVPKVGRFAVLQDPQGAAIGVIAGEGEQPGPG